MKNRRTYLDYNATAPLLPEAREAAIQAFDLVGNASSVHGEGREARALVEEARDSVAALLGAKSSEVVFTCGATEANNWVLSAGWETVFVAGIEHESVLAPASTGRSDLIDIPVGADGVAAVGSLADESTALHEAGRKVLVSLQMANNETGVLQPVAEMIGLVHSSGWASHSDATQAVGRVPIDFAALGLDYLSMSGHKIGAPKGVGVLVIREGAELASFMKGGGQERRRRAGTENIAAIAGLGAAASGACQSLARIEEIRRLRDRLEAGVRAVTPDVQIIGGEVPRICNTSCLALPGKSAPSLLIKLDLAGIAVGAGSACSSGKIGGSHVMQAMGIAPAIAEAAIRVSLGWESTMDDVDAFLQAWSQIAVGGAIWPGAVNASASGAPINAVVGE